MKTIIKEKPGISAGVSMGRMVIESTVDSESVRVRIPFYIGANEFMVRGTLNIIENIFHWNNESDLEDYFEGYDIDIESSVEKR